MGSTAVGRAFSTISDPISEWSTRNFDGGAREREVAGLKNREAETAANKAIDDLEEQKRQQKLIKERDAGRARARAVSANSEGRASTILTNPSAYFGDSASAAPPRKTLLGM